MEEVVDEAICYNNDNSNEDTEENDDNNNECTKLDNNQIK